MAWLARNRFFEDEDEERPEKPRHYGLTDIRAPSYSFTDPTRLEDILEAMGQFVDGLKFAGGTCSLMPKTFIKEITEMAHKHKVTVATGDWAELLLQKGPSGFKQYVQECKDLGFDIIDLNADSLKVPEETLLRLIRIIKNERLKAKPLFGINFEKSSIPSKEDRAFGAYIAPTPKGSEMIEDVELLIRKAERCLEAGADMIMIDADGISGRADMLRTDAIAKIIGRLGLEKTMFEASSPETFEWFVRRYGSRVNLFVDHSHVGKLECFRSGALGMNPSSVFRSRRLGPALFY